MFGKLDKLLKGNHLCGAPCLLGPFWFHGALRSGLGRLRLDLADMSCKITTCMALFAYMGIFQTNPGRIPFPSGPCAQPEKNPYKGPLL